MKIAFWIGLWLSICLGPSQFALANVGDEYGFGSRAIALGGGGVAWGFDGYSSYYNPAATALDRHQRLIFSFGLIDMIPMFKPMQNIVVSNDFTGDTSEITATVDNKDYRATFGQAIGLSYLLFPEFHHLSFGLTAFVPINQLGYFNTGDPYIPEFVLYRARTQRPQFELGFGGQVTPRLYLGVGMHMSYSLTGSTSIFLQTSSARTSSMTFEASLKPKFAPYFGVYYDSSDQFSLTGASKEASGEFTAGAVVRFPVASANSLDVNANARALGNIASLPFSFKAISSFFYDPYTLELGASYKLASPLRVLAQMDYQVWSKYEAPAISFTDPSTCVSRPCGVAISPTQNPSFELRNTLKPHGGVEYALGESSTLLRVGYAYHQSIFKSVPNGNGNYLDPSKHIFSAGVGFKFNHFLNYETPWNLDLFGSWHQLITQTITKTANDERGLTGNKVGSPGYEAGGKIIGGGASVSFAF